jgi:hypothetical protein
VGSSNLQRPHHLKIHHNTRVSRTLDLFRGGTMDREATELLAAVLKNERHINRIAAADMLIGKLHNGINKETLDHLSTMLDSERLRSERDLIIIEKLRTITSLIYVRSMDEKQLMSAILDNPSSDFKLKSADELINRLQRGLEREDLNLPNRYRKSEEWRTTIDALENTIRSNQWESEENENILGKLQSIQILVVKNRSARQLLNSMIRNPVCEFNHLAADELIERLRNCKDRDVLDRLEDSLLADLWKKQKDENIREKLQTIAHMVDIGIIRNPRRYETRPSPIPPPSKPRDNPSGPWQRETLRFRKR